MADKYPRHFACKSRALLPVNTMEPPFSKSPAPERINRIVYWTPRILSMVFILFLALFSLDVFEEKLDFWQTALALLMHNIPAIILAIILIISWKHEIVGGIAFIIAGLVYIALIIINGFRFSFEWYQLVWTIQIAVPAFFIGILFLIGWKQREKIRKQNIKGDKI